MKTSKETKCELNMKAKDKAKELVDKYYNSEQLCSCETISIVRNNAIECAKIAVDEIIEAIDWHEFETPNKELEYWQEVKNELNKML